MLPEIGQQGKPLRHTVQLLLVSIRNHGILDWSRHKKKFKRFCRLLPGKGSKLKFLDVRSTYNFRRSGNEVLLTIFLVSSDIYLVYLVISDWL